MCISLGKLPARPLLSVIVPSFNQGRFIRATLDSILAQDYRPIEILVVDGASRDETVDVLRSYGEIPELRWVSERDSGVVAAVNKGLHMSNGAILAIQSSDDVYLPDAFRTMTRELLNHQFLGLVYADYETVDAQGSLLYSSKLRPFSLQAFLCKETRIPQPTAFFRRELVDACGGWDSRYFNADTELWLRFVFRTQAKKVEAVIARRRLHDGQRNQRKAEIFDSYRRMVNESADLKSSSLELQRLARAGVHLHAIKYSGSGSTLVKSYHLWRAMLLAPRLWPVVRKSPLLIPGWLAVKSGASRLKQKVLSVG